eukprot:gene12721-3442_t
MSTWRDEIHGSEVLFQHKMEVPVRGLIHLTSGCNTILKSKYNEDEPDRKDAIITIYGKEGHGKSIEELRKIVEKVNNFRNIIRYKFTGYPPILRVDFPYLKKYKEELKNCTALVVEVPYEYQIVAQVKGEANIYMKDFENEYTSGYADLGNIELSKIKTVYAECFSGGDIVCRDSIHGSGHFWTMLDGGIYMKKLQGINFALNSMNGDIKTETVYCDDVVYTNEQGDVITGLVQSTGCHVETENGNLKIDSVSCENLVGRIFKKGTMDFVVEKTKDMYIYHGEGGDVNLKIGPSVEMEMEVQSKSSSVSSQIDFKQLEKYNDPVNKYMVTKGTRGAPTKKWLIENHHGHFAIDQGNWMDSLKLKIPNLNP